LECDSSPSCGTRCRADWPLIVITALSVTLYLTSNLMAVKLLAIGGVTWFDCGTLLFPLVYMLGDVLSEVWGYAVARRVIWLTFGCMAIMLCGTALAICLPSPGYQAGVADAYRLVYGFVPRIVIASLIAFLCGSLANAWSLVKIRQWTGRRWLWVRTIGSSIYGYIFDNALFILLAFGFRAPWRDLLSMMLIQFVAKMAMEACLATPMAYAVIHLISENHSEH